MNKKLLSESIQGIVNFYNGEYGPVKEIHEGFNIRMNKDFENLGWLKHDTNIVFYVNNKILYVYIKGTDNISDWISNLWPSKRLVPYSNVNSKIKIRKGFLDGYSVMRDWNLNKIQYYDKVIYIGHSRGAAIAKLAAVDTQYHYPDKDITVIGFGTPAVGNKYFENSYIRRIPKTYLFKYGLDVVTFLPPMIWGYKNGSQIKIGKPTWIIPNGWDHRPDKYIQGIKDFK